MILNLFLGTGTVYGYYCTHNQYRCDRRYNSNYYYDYGTWGCINSTLACNGELDCSFFTSDEQGCGMFPRDDMMIVLPLRVDLHNHSSHYLIFMYMYYPLHFQGGGGGGGS